MEYARAATTAMSKRKSAPRAALEAVAAPRQPSCPASARRPERPLEPHGIEDSQAVKYGRDQNPHAIAVVEVCQCVGRCADLRLMVVDDVRDYEAEDGLDAGCPPQAFPERGGCVDAGGGGRACGCAHEDLHSN